MAPLLPTIAWPEAPGRAPRVQDPRASPLTNSNHPNHTVLARKLQKYLRWRNANAHHPDILAAQRRVRARVRNERQQRWGHPRLKAARTSGPATVHGQRSRRSPDAVLANHRPHRCKRADARRETYFRIFSSVPQYRIEHHRRLPFFD
jgi:hypothetical protein